MNLSDLSASELARIDAICLEFEANLRAGIPQSIDDLVARCDGPHADLLRQELQAVHDELAGSPGNNFSTEGLPTFSADVELPATGTTIGRYIVGELLGRGGMGVVYKAIDPRLDRQVAIKILAVGSSKRRQLTERFEREAKAVATLSHPNIVELFDVGVTQGLPYAVMEYLDGELLDERFKRGPMEPNEVRRLGAQIADALAAAHAGGVIHRDLKPHNIMLVRRQGGDSKTHAAGSTPENSESTIIKLFDFGLSRAPRHVFDGAEETGEGIVLGTPGYMAPEQARAETVSPAADLFSLGCVLYEAFYGERAFGGDTSAARFKATIEQTPHLDPIRRRSDVELADLIERCLEKSAADRPDSAVTVAKLLRQHGPPKDPVVERIESGYAAGEVTRRRVLAMMGGAVVGGLAGGIVANQQVGEIGDIHSLAVLSFSDVDFESDPRDMSTTLTAMSEPIGTREMRRGEKLAALLVHELTRLSELMVPRFRPMIAETPEEFRKIGDELDVDALLTGSIRTIEQGASKFLLIDIQLVSTESGNQLWGKQFQSDFADSYLHQSKLATEIATALGRRLTSTAEEAAPPSVESFNCLVDGKTRSDPESVAGLEMALQCFQRAHQVDRRFADPLAGIALTSITLAAQSSSEKSIALIIRAREAAAEALLLDPTSIDARLATAMLDWQTTNRYEQAERTLRELAMVAPNNWQVLHQYGLLQLATGQFSEASTSLREASQINPWSILAKVDRARAMWFSGNTERAIQDASRIRDKYKGNRLARGLLVDIFEHLKRYGDAAAEHDDWKAGGEITEQVYLPERSERLLDLPYGPYGVVMNQAIWQTRTRQGIDELQLAEIADATPPALPLLLAAHPSFSAVRTLARAQEILPTRA